MDYISAYLDGCNAIIYQVGSQWVISTPEDNYTYASHEAMLQDIEYTLSQWEVER